MTDSVKFEYDLRQAAEKILRDDIEEFMSGDSEPAAIDFERILNRRYAKRISVIKPYLTAAAAVLAVGAAVFVFARTHSLNISAPVPETAAEMTESGTDIVSEPEPETKTVPAAETETDSENVTESETVETITETSFEPAPAIVETEPPSPAVPAQAARADETIPADPAVGGGENTCIHAGVFNDSFHTFDLSLIELVGGEQFDEWISENTGKPSKWFTSDECRAGPINIYEFIKHFDIDRETFEKLYYHSDSLYSKDYNIDLLYGDDEQAVYEYYSHGGNYAEMMYRRVDHSIKGRLIQYIGVERYNEWMSAGNRENYIEWSIAEMIYVFDIQRESFEDIVCAEIERINNDIERLPKFGHMDENGNLVIETEGIETYNVMLEACDYDVDFIYGEREYIESIIGKTEPYKIDRMCHNF
ncbi:MAG: hypothetical protein K6D94_04330 [Clostridiales bacterium]|nr:hypothetical protein [Clostridiales bacterium]